MKSSGMKWSCNWPLEPRGDWRRPFFVRACLENWSDVIHALDVGAKAEEPDGQNHPKDETVPVWHDGRGTGVDRAVDVRPRASCAPTGGQFREAINVVPYLVHSG